MGRTESHARHRKQELYSRRKFMSNLGYAAAGVGLDLKDLTLVFDVLYTFRAESIIPPPEVVA